MRVEGYFRNLILESCLSDDYSNQRAISYVSLLFTELLRRHSADVRTRSEERNGYFSRILCYIQKNYASVTLSELAQMFHYNESYLSDLIRKSTGSTFSALLLRLRMDAACRYLKNSNMKIADIAEIVGYTTTDHFSRMFRKEFGVSPAAFRKGQRQTKTL